MWITFHREVSRRGRAWNFPDGREITNPAFLREACSCVHLFFQRQPNENPMRGSHSSLTGFLKNKKFSILHSCQESPGHVYRIAFNSIESILNFSGSEHCSRALSTQWRSWTPRVPDTQVYPLSTHWVLRHFKKSKKIHFDALELELVVKQDRVRRCRAWQKVVSLLERILKNTAIAICKLTEPVELIESFQHTPSAMPESFLQQTSNVNFFGAFQSLVFQTLRVSSRVLKEPPIRLPQTV